MATNKNALIRYRTIDKCLQNRSRRWTLEDLIVACSDALYEYEGKDTNVSKRTVQLDIQNMRSDKLGYNAPIICYERKYYTYENPRYTITDIPVTDLDLDVLHETMQILSQFKDFALLREFHGVIQKLEDRIYSETGSSRPIIHLDKNEKLKGLEHLDSLYQAVLKKLVLRITYKSFKARNSQEITMHPYVLKEFNNRWFVVGQNHASRKILTLALDRIEKIDYALELPYRDIDFDADQYYRHTYGVTVMNDASLAQIKLRIDRHNAPYVLTKPFHHSQRMIDKLEDGSVIIEVRLHLNFELERLILGFGEAIEVLSPPQLRSRIQRKLRRASRNYEDTEGA